MESDDIQNRGIVRKLTLREEGEELPYLGSSPADRLNMMWQIAQDCWSFVPGYDAQQEFQRHVTRLERRER